MIHVLELIIIIVETHFIVFHFYGILDKESDHILSIDTEVTMMMISRLLSRITRYDIRYTLSLNSNNMGRNPFPVMTLKNVIYSSHYCVPIFFIYDT